MLLAIMSFWRIFGKGPLSDKQIAKAAALAANSFAQPDVRMREMERLIDDGSPAAIRGLLKRFAVNAHGHIADEDEKKWLEDALVEIGQGAVAPLEDYISTEDKLTYALRAYERIVGSEAAAQCFLNVLKRYGADDYRSVEAKLQLVWQLASYIDAPQVLAELVPFLLDHSDDVRWAVIDLLERAADKKALPAEILTQASEKLAVLVVDPEVSLRISRRTADVLAEREWPLQEGAALNAFLGDDFFLDKKRLVRRRK